MLTSPISSLAFLAMVASAPTPAPPAAPTQTQPLDQLVSLLSEKKWDEAFVLVAGIAPPSAPTPAGRRAAHSIAQSAAECRKADAAMSFAFSALAARLAPDDAAILTSHAESLLSLEQRGEAAAVLDRVLQEHPEGDVAATRLLRARLADMEGDFQLSITLLTPLLDQPSYRDEAGALLRSARAGLEARGASDEKLPGKPRASSSAGAADAAVPSRPRHPSGTVVASLPGSVNLKGSMTLVAKGLVRGQSYLFQATGSCSRAERTYRTPCEYPCTGAARRAGGCGGDVMRLRPSINEITGVDFRVRFGSQTDSRSLSAGQRGARDVNKVDFIAEGPDQTIQVFDESTVDKDVSCTMGEFKVVAD
jgi:hypothetical protein